MEDARNVNSKPGGLRNVRLISVWALAVLSLAILFLTREIETHSLLAALLLVPLAALSEARRPIRKTVWLQNAVVLSLFAASAFRFFATETAFLLIVADFLIFFMLLKLLFEKDESDLMQIIALSFFLLLSASTLALDFSFLIGFILYILGATWTLTIHTLAGQLPTGASARAATRAPEAAPSGDAVGADSDLRDLYRFARRNAWITLGLVTLFSIGIFIFFPRLSLAVFQGAFLNPAHESGYSDTVNLRKSGTIRESETLVMRVEVAPEQRALIGQGYLRGHTLAAFNGQGWSALPKSGKNPEAGKPFIQKMVKNYFPVAGPAKDLLSKEFEMSVGSRSYIRQDIYLESTGYSTLFGLPWIDTIEAKLPQILIGDDGSVRRPEASRGRLHYTVKSLAERPQEAVLIRRSRDAFQAQERSNSEPDLAPYLALPDMDRAKLQNLLSKIVNRRDSPYAKARKIEQYLSRNYLYNRTVRPKDLDRPVESFLFEDRQGACEYFASAMAVMLRMERIPARIVNGFLMRDWNPKGNYFVVRAKDAHSWVEAEMGGIWVPFDPSPIVTGTEPKDVSLWQAAREQLEYWNFLWTSYVLGYDMESQKNIAKNVELKSSALSVHFERFSESWRRKIWGSRKQKTGDKNDSETTAKNTRTGSRTLMVFSAGGGVLTALFLCLFGIKKWREKRLRTARGNGQGDFYFELLRLFARRGWTLKSGETPLEFQARLEREIADFGAVQPSARNLQSIFYRVRYGGQRVDESGLRDIKKEIQTLKDEIKKIHG